MKSQLERAIERQRATNKPMNLISTLISTQRGWLVRQALKFATWGGVAASTWLASKGFHLDNPEAVTSALATLAVGATEFLLSKAASKIAAK